MPPFQYSAHANPFAMSIAETLAKRGDIAAQRALATAQAQAQAQQARGQIWGNAVQAIGQQVAAIPQQMQARRDAAQQAEARTIELQNARAEQAAGRKAVEDKSILASAQGSGLEPEQVKAQLRQLGRGDLIPIYEQTHASLETARLGLQKAKDELAGHEADYFGAMAAGIKKANGDPMAVEWALAQAEADGHDTKQIRAVLQQRPDALPQIVDTLIEKSPTQRKLMGEEQDRALKTKQEERAIKTAEQAAADRIADNRRQEAANAEAARHNRATEANAAANDAAVPSLTSQGLDAAAQMYAQTGQLPAMGMGGKAANVRAAIINRAAELFPDLNIAANKAEYGATSGTLTQLQKQRAAIGAFEQTAQKNIDLFLDQAKKIVDTGSPLLNTPVRAVTGKMLGAPDQAAYDAARQVAINEIAKITSNPTLAGQLSDSARHEVEAFNPSNATLKQTIAVMNLLKRDMQNRTKSLDDAIAQQRGSLRGSAGSASGRIRARDPQGNIHEAPAGTPLPEGWVAVP